MPGRGAKDAVYKALGKVKFMAASLGNAVKKKIDERVQIQKNFSNRKDNSNYYGTINDFN